MAWNPNSQGGRQGWSPATPQPPASAYPQTTPPTTYPGRTSSSLGYPAAVTSPGQDAKFEAIFMLIDEDGDGRINVSELQQALEMNGANLSHAEVRTVMQKADTNGNGTLSLSEFKAWMKGPSTSAPSGPQLEDSEFKRLFSLFDENGDGRISVVELWKTMQYVGIGLSFAHAEDMMKVADTNRDGAIDFHEFKKVMADAMGPQGTMSLYPAPDPRLKRVFAVMDENGDGKINIRELYKGLKLLGLNLSLAEVMAIMRDADKNDDALLDFREFSKVIHIS